MSKQAEPLMVRDTRFWVVRPRVGLSGVSGLGTLLSGAYIEIDPGKGHAASEFVGLKEPPPVTSDMPGRRYVLEADSLGSIERGAPVYYNGLRVGQVLAYHLDAENRGFNIPIFIEAPYDQLVRVDSRFWNASGVDVSISAEGVNIGLESLPALLSGGVAFETPSIGQKGEAPPAETTFHVFASKRQIAEAAFTRKIPYIAYFDGSVRGLKPGAPVEFRGLRVGRVTDVRMVLDPKNFDIAIPVTFEIEPGHVDILGAAPDLAPYEGMAQFVRKGLRAQLKSGNILTGELVVSLDLHPEAPPAEIETGGLYPEIPTVPTELEEITRSVNEVLGKVASAPIPELVAEVRGVVGRLDALMTSPEAVGTLTALRQSAEDLQTLLRTADSELGPLAQSLERTSGSLSQTLDTADETLLSINRTLGEDSRLRYDLAVMLRELTTAARSIRGLTEYLERHPEALIHGKAGAPQ
jgi:paraquat-inducible protein B